MKFPLDEFSARDLATFLRNPRTYPHWSEEFDLYLTLARLGDRHGQDNGIAARLIEWALDCQQFEIDDDAPAADLARAMIETLERIDCAACSAPSGLIYNHDLGAEAGRHWFEIDAALDDYHDETGESPTVRDEALRIGFLVWFAYEWNAHKLASLMRSVFDLDG